MRYERFGRIGGYNTRPSPDAHEERGACPGEGQIVGQVKAAFESARPGGLPDRRVRAAQVTVAFQCDDGRELSLDVPVGALEGLSDEELILLLTRGLK